MDEKEIEKLLNPQKKLWILLLTYLTISFVCIGLVFYQRFQIKCSNDIAMDFSDLLVSDLKKEDQYIKMMIDYPPIFLAQVEEKAGYLYFGKDLKNQPFLAILTNETFQHLINDYNSETGKLNSTYQIKGMTKKIDEKIKSLVLENRDKISTEEELTSINMGAYFKEVYVQQEEGAVSEKMITLYTVSVLTGLFFLILSFGYIIPGIRRVRKRLSNQVFINQLRVQLANLTSFPYQQLHLYLTKDYLVTRLDAIKYEDITSGYIEKVTKHWIKSGENLIIKTKDGKKHVVASVVKTTNLLNQVLIEIKMKNENVKIEQG